MVYFTWFIHYVYTPVPYDTSALMKKSWQVGDVKIITLGLLKQKRILILDVVCKQTRQINKQSNSNSLARPSKEKCLLNICNRKIRIFISAIHQSTNVIFYCNHVFAIMKVCVINIAPHNAMLMCSNTYLDSLPHF